MITFESLTLLTSSRKLKFETIGLGITSIKMKFVSSCGLFQINYSFFKFLQRFFKSAAFPSLITMSFSKSKSWETYTYFKKKVYVAGRKLYTVS